MNIYVLIYKKVARGRPLVSFLNLYQPLTTSRPGSPEVDSGHSDFLLGFND